MKIEDVTLFPAYYDHRSRTVQSPELSQQDKDDIERLLGSLFVIPLDIDLAREAGDIRSRYGLKTPDSAIAATAMRYRSTLVIRNIRDFRRIPTLLIQVI